MNFKKYSLRDILIVLMSLGMLVSISVTAQDTVSTDLSKTEAVKPAVLPTHPSVYNFYLENDLFNNTDRDYTSGFKVSWVSPNLADYTHDPHLPQWVRNINQLLVRIQPGQYESRNLVVTAGQAIYTPYDWTATAVIPNDRPYAGWLYLGLGYNGRTQWEMDTVEVNVGMVGPAALARQTQHVVHAIRHIDQFKGWQNQLHNELGVQLVAERKRRVWSGGQTLKWDAITHYGTSLGNVQTYLNTGIELRIGSRLPADFGTSAIRPASDSNAPTESGRQRRLSGEGVHMFVAVDARFVIRDIFLDGNTFRASHQVTKNPFVADLAVGIAWQWKGGKITYSKCLRTKEFETQNASHSYGSIMLSLEH